MLSKCTQRPRNARVRNGPLSDKGLAEMAASVGLGSIERSPSLDEGSSVELNAPAAPRAAGAPPAALRPAAVALSSSAQGAAAQPATHRCCAV